jgi:two-component system response regulator MprA
VLLVDDEPQILDFLCLGFTYDGFAVQVARTGPEALQSLTQQQPALVILDLLLPGLDGMAVAQQIRQEHDTAIIMLTARDDIEDRVAGLDIGADDYVTKPFAFKELMARVRAVLRRQGKYILITTLLFSDTPALFTEKRESTHDFAPRRSHS